MSTICIVDECEEPIHGKGLCNKHRIRLARHGSTDPTQIRFDSMEEAFLARTEPQGECVVWTGPDNAQGYGVITVKGERKYAHVFAWERENGAVPEGHEIDHMCRRTRCVKISHLRIATHAQNLSHRGGASSNSSTGVRNVYRAGSKYRVGVTLNGKYLSYGRFATLEEATEVAEAVRDELFGEYARGKGQA